ncbi:hypothetical protein BSKO_00670 [Bryopsis sp. KO-2023]|nr:hypothetical protein BSKO_00670 [Bryopsis sp. KO-2023]
MVDKVLLQQGLSLLGGLLWETLRLAVEVPAALFWCAASSLGFKPDTASGKCYFYEGSVFHVRRAPKENSFAYPVRMSIVDLDDPPPWWKLQSKHHWNADQVRAKAKTDGGVKLLTNPVSCGYVENPISIYYCYSQNGDLEKCIAEVTNTPWGERTSFLFNPDGETVPKSLHVSPFMDMQNVWKLRAPHPSKTLMVSVHVSHPDHGDYFDAVLTGRRCESTAQRGERDGFRTLWRYGFQPQRVAFWIYWQAVKLLWKGVSFYSPPDKSYRSEVCKAAGQKECFSNGEKFTWQHATSCPWNLT